MTMQSSTSDEVGELRAWAVNGTRPRDAPPTLARDALPTLACL